MVWTWTADDAVNMIVERSNALDDAAPWAAGQNEAERYLAPLRQHAELFPDGAISSGTTTEAWQVGGKSFGATEPEILLDDPAGNPIEIFEPAS